MRIWSLHPKHLDQKGLVALWRETLLAQKVLQGLTKGYKNHSQLIRFKATEDPVKAISTYLHYVADEADRRGYNFNRSKIVYEKGDELLDVTGGQIDFEIEHLMKKLETRDPERHGNMLETFFTNCMWSSEFRQVLLCHPMFTHVDGEIESWEKV